MRFFLVLAAFSATASAITIGFFDDTACADESVGNGCTGFNYENCCGFEAGDPIDLYTACAGALEDTPYEANAALNAYSSASSANGGCGGNSVGSVTFTEGDPLDKYLCFDGGMMASISGCAVLAPASSKKRDECRSIKPNAFMARHNGTMYALEKDSLEGRSYEHFAKTANKKEKKRFVMKKAHHVSEINL